jgi:predicted transcriptional regulator
METSADRLMFAMEEQWKHDKLTKTQKYILSIIKANPGCQNSDAKLLEAIWTHEGWQDGKSLYWNLSRVTSSETATRARRKLHELGLITYTKEVEKKRYHNYKDMTLEYSQDIASKIVNPKVEYVLVDNEWITRIR